MTAKLESTTYEINIFRKKKRQIETMVRTRGLYKFFIVIKVKNGSEQQMNRICAYFVHAASDYITCRLERFTRFVNFYYSQRFYQYTVKPQALPADHAVH